MLTERLWQVVLQIVRDVDAAGEVSSETVEKARALKHVYGRTVASLPEQGKMTPVLEDGRHGGNP